MFHHVMLTKDVEIVSLVLFGEYYKFGEVSEHFNVKVLVPM